MNSCFFIGHRDAPSDIQERLDQTVEYLVRSCGVREFVVEQHGSFNTMAGAAVCRIKKLEPEVRLLRLLCYHPGQAKMILPHGFDDFYYPLELNGTPARFAILKANELMIEQCDYLVAYVVRSGGNAAKFLSRGSRLEKMGRITIIDLANDHSSTG